MRHSALASLAVYLVSAGYVFAQVPVYGQCGGINYTGSTVCASGSVCVYQNDYYSQCLPGSSTPTSTTSKGTTTSTTSATSKSSTSTTSHVTTSSTTSKTTSTSTKTTSSPVSTATGFVKVSGQKFTLGGKDFVPAGTNAYWLAQESLTADIQQALTEAATAGYTYIRTWGFNDVTSGAGTYYQLWSNGVGTINTGVDGLQKFDTVVAAAKAAGIKLVVPFVNNWSDYGGMDVYVKQIVGSSGTHDSFYTNANVVAAYKKYIAAFVARYVNEPTIMAWELANEPRCGGTLAASSSCTSATVTAWAKDISAYIKSIDPNHLVAIGDEGFINDPGNPIYVYNGLGIGIDYAANLNISTLDFGTFHMYPESWGEGSNTAASLAFGTQWITDHAAMQKAANKPSILEEYGVSVNQSSVYASWGATIVSSGITGEGFWQLGSHSSEGFYWDDGGCVYPDSGAIYSTLVQVTADLKARG